jgi:hypothetical protein
MAISIEAFTREDGRGRISLLDPTREYGAHRAELLAACERVLGRMQLLGGEELHAFATEMASYLGTRHACGAASGTDALWLARKHESPPERECPAMPTGAATQGSDEDGRDHWRTRLQGRCEPLGSVRSTS